MNEFRVADMGKASPAASLVRFACKDPNATHNPLNAAESSQAAPTANNTDQKALTPGDDRAWTKVSSKAHKKKKQGQDDTSSKKQARGSRLDCGPASPRRSTLPAAKVPEFVVIKSAAPPPPSIALVAKAEDSIKVHVPFPFKEAHNRVNWENELRERAQGTKTTILIPEIGVEKPFEVIDYPINCLFALSPRFRMFFQSWNKSDKNALTLPKGWASHIVFSTIANWFERFCLRQIEYYEPLTFRITHLAQAIRLYITLKNIGLTKGSENAEAAIHYFIKKDILTADDVEMFFLTEVRHTNALLKAVARQLIELRLGMLGEYESGRIAAFLYQKAPVFLQVLIKMENEMLDPLADTSKATPITFPYIYRRARAVLLPFPPGVTASGSSRAKVVPPSQAIMRDIPASERQWALAVITAPPPSKVEKKKDN
jgi:hypothetical protein